MEKGEYYLCPGNLFVHREPHIVTTILGSCVAVCLWDPVPRIGGINHFMLPVWNGEGPASPRYGDIAIKNLIEQMLLTGCDMKRLVAKIFGGGEVLGVIVGPVSVSRQNIEIALKILRKENIPVIASSVGGSVGRRLIYDTEKGSVLLKKLRPQEATKILSRDDFPGR